MKATKKIACTIFAVLLFVGIFPTAALAEPQANTGFQPNFTITAKAAVLINMDSKQTIYEKNADQKMYPASLTKMMTAIVVMENIKDLDKTTATAKQSHFDEFAGIDISNADIKTGETLTIRQLLYCLMMQSANESANILADSVAGSQQKFVEMMNNKAKEIGAASTHYANPHGLYNDEHYSTARDQAVILEYAWKNEALKTMMCSTSYIIPKTNKHAKRELYHTLGMLSTTSKQYREYIKGGKTGFEDLAGRCLASVASQNNVNYLCVTMNSKWQDGNGNTLNTNYAYVDTAKICDWAFNTLQVISAAKPSEAISEVRVKASFKSKHALLYPKEDFFVVIPAGKDSSVIEKKFDIPDSMMAPVKAGDTVGTVEFSFNGSVVGKVDLIAGEDLSRSWILFGFEMVKSVLASPLVQIALVLVLLCVLFYIYLTVQVNKKKKRAKQAASGRGRNVPPQSRTQTRRTPVQGKPQKKRKRK